MLTYLFLAFLLYIVYKFVFGLVLPIYKTTKQVKKQFNAMQEKMQDQFGQFGNTQQETKQQPTPTPKSNKDYIDFEEVE